MNPQQYEDFQRQVSLRLHDLVRRFLDRGVRVEREEVVAAAISFGLQHLDILVEDARRNPAR